MNVILLACLGVFAGASLSAEAAPADPSVLPEVGRGIVQTVEGNLVLRMDDGRRIRLSGIRLPAAGSAVAQQWRERATDRVRTLVENRPVIFHYPEGYSDRHGRILAQAMTQSREWVQKILVAEGLIAVVPMADERPLVRDLLEAEAAARNAGRGIWSQFLRVRSPETLTKADVGQFAVVEGLVRSAAKVRGTTYLNFGDDWRTDFTVTIPAASASAFRSEGVDPQAWAEKAIRIRGWVRWYNGPMIEVDHPDWIEGADGAEPAVLQAE